MPLRDPFGMLFAGSIVSCRIVSPSLERSPTTRVGALGDVESASFTKSPWTRRATPLSRIYHR